MNNGPQGQPQGQPGAQQARPTIFRPEQMRQLPDGAFSQAEKTKWETGLTSLYKQIENAPQAPEAAQEAKLYLFLPKLTKYHI